MIDTADSRFAKAVAIADHAAQWLKCRAKDGKKVYGVPSQSTPGHYHLTTQTSCSCYDGQRRICKHIQAVLIHCARMAGKPMPATEVLDGLDGLEQMVIDRQGPVLDMVREPDGTLRWERHQHPNGDTFYMPRPSRPPLPPETIALAAKYSAIHERFDETPEQTFGRL